MPKDVERNRYYTAAVPKQSRLQYWIDHFHGETNEAESQLLVHFAAEYVRMHLDGQVVVPVVQPSQPTPVLVQPSGASDEELSAYGDPD